MSDEQEPQSHDSSWHLSGDSFAEAESGFEAGHCLVVSRSLSTQKMIAQAAREAGWGTIGCTDIASAMIAVHRSRFEMAWVELAAGSELNASGEILGTDGTQSTTEPIGRWRELCEAIAGLPRVLLAVCGAEQDIREEIWARQLGVWLYLPGISCEDAADITALCEQALLVANGSHASY